MRFRTLSDRWQAASNCMVPRTFISLAMLRAADDAGVADAEACTTVSTPAASITLAINGFRMSTRAKSAPPIRARAAGSGQRGIHADHPVHLGMLGEPAGECTNR